MPTVDMPENISVGGKSSPKKDFGTSIYNVNPIEVYIENRSQNPSGG
jgi:hypothetical protein